jgi:hypothetical protein
MRGCLNVLEALLNVHILQEHWYCQGFSDVLGPGVIVECRGD